MHTLLDVHCCEKCHREAGRKDRSLLINEYCRPQGSAQYDRVTPRLTLVVTHCNKERQWREDDPRPQVEVDVCTRSEHGRKPVQAPCHDRAKAGEAEPHTKPVSDVCAQDGDSEGRNIARDSWSCQLGDGG